MTRMEGNGEQPRYADESLADVRMNSFLSPSG